MANQKTIDKTSNKISSMYIDGITQIVDELLKIKKGLSNKDFTTILLSLNMEEIVKSKLVNINKEYVLFEQIIGNTIIQSKLNHI